MPFHHSIICKFSLPFVLLISLLVALPAAPKAGELTQFFPAVPEGQPAPEARSGWRIKWEVLEAGTHTYGGTAVLEFQSIEFMKGKKSDGSEDWIQVLNNLALAEMYVPYNNGTSFFDISGFNFSLLRARPDYLATSGVVSSKIEGEYLVSEVVDEGVRWLDNRDNFKVQRGQALRLWTHLHAANYTYTIIYTFADDGRISARVGGTAQNFQNWDGSLPSLNSASHAHMGAWRMEFDLGEPASNKIEIVERVNDPATAQPSILFRPFNGGREGGELWNPARYTKLKVTNLATQNRHNPPRNVSYVLKTVKSGKLRTQQAVTEFDFWVSRVFPDSPTRQVLAPELKFVDLPANIAVPEPIDGNPVAIWHNAGLYHIPRGEDFGVDGYIARDGAAINSFAGFDLVPVNLWHKTPFLDR